MATQTKNKTEHVGYYPIEGRKLPSVTAVMDYALGLPSALLDWSAAKGAKALIDYLAECKKNGVKVPSQKKLIDIAVDARQVKLHNSQALGLALHEAIEIFLQTGKEPEGLEKLEVERGYTAQDYFDAFKRWYQENPIVPVLQEGLVWDLEYGFAGRFDFYGTLHGQTILIDFKTSNLIKPEYGIQLSAYKHCIENLGHEVAHTYVLYIKPEGCSFVRYDEPFSVFLTLLDVFKWKVSVHIPEWRERMSEKEVYEEIENTHT